MLSSIIITITVASSCSTQTELDLKQILKQKSLPQIRCFSWFFQ